MNTVREQLLEAEQMILDILATNPSEAVDKIRQSILNALDDLSEPAGKEYARLVLEDANDTIIDSQKDYRAETILPPPDSGIRERDTLVDEGHPLFI